MPTSSLARRTAAPLLAVLAAFGCTLLVLTLRNGGDATLPAVRSGVAPLRPDAGTDATIARLQAAVRRGADRRADLAAAYLQKARETGDPGFYRRAHAVLAPALARGNDPAALAVGAALAASRHQFGAALRLSRSARALAPEALGAYPVLVDALVELGRYGAAEAALQRFADAKPGLPAYARISYLRELHGDLDGAVAAMRAAASAGGAAPENAAAVDALLAQLELARGRVRAARRSVGAALAAVPGHVAALAVRARIAAATGDLPGAIARWRGIVARRPLPEYAIALGEAELAAGRRAQARKDLALVAAERALLAAAGVNTDVELALFEADHGDSRRAVALARAAWAAAPSIRSADARGWALTRSGDPAAGAHWAARALRLGWLDPLARFHAGIAARAAGRAAEARRQLRLALAHGLAAYPWQAQQAQRALGAGR